MLFFITLLGLLLRLTFIDKAEGLWNDEYVSWFVASTNDGFWNEILKQCHMPLYYLYLKPFVNCSDLVLRFLSVIPAVIAIIVMYYLGKEFSKKVAYYLALITSVLSFLIYYAQEVRFYSILFLFSALSLLFTIKYLKKSSKKNLTGYFISNILVLLTHVLGIIYVTFNALYVVYKKKKLTKSVVIFFVLCLLFVIPLGLKILEMLPSSQWWGHFSYTNILFLFSDFYSPILTNNVNAPTEFFYNKDLILWLTIPTLIGVIGLVAGFKRAKGVFIIAFLTLLSMIILALSGKIVFITKYATEILPILLLITSFGFARMKSIGTVLLTVFISFHLASFFTPYYVTKIKRNEGHRIVAEILKHQDADNVIFTYYADDRFYRYINLNSKKTYYISKINRFEYVDNPSVIFNNIKKDETVSVVFLDSVSFFDDNFIKTNENNKNIPEMFMTFSIIKNRLIEVLDNDYKDFEVNRGGAWTVIKAKKK